MIPAPHELNKHDVDASLDLAPDHLADLRRSGLTDATIRAAGIRTERDARQVRTLLNWSGASPKELGPCLVLPYFQPDGSRDGYVRIKPSRPRKDRKTGKSIKYEAPKGSTNRLYLPLHTRRKLTDRTVPLVVTEGEKKGLAADQAGFPCVGLSGVWSWQTKRPRMDGKAVGPRELIPDLASVAWNGRHAILAFDSDAVGNENVAWAEWHLAEALTKLGATVVIARLPAGPPGPAGEPAKVGVDDFLVAHGPDAFRRLLKSAGPPAKPDFGDDRPTIVITTEEHDVNNCAVKALAADADLYQRCGLLVRVAEDVHPEQRSIRRPAGPRIEPILPPSLRERLTRCAQWFKLKETADGPIEVPAHPPTWAVSAVHARGRWPGVRPLEAIVEYPVLRPDGAILTTPGYDMGTTLIYAPSGPVEPVPAQPTAAEIRAAVGALHDVVHDFPFETDAHKAAWVAALLTPLARFAFTGPAPMFLADANVRAAGKTLLLETIGYIITGGPMTVSTYTADQDELRKRITSLAVEGDRLVLLDNLAGTIRNPVLDAALTSETWKDRILGVNRMVAAPLLVTWYASGNNAQLYSDTARRTCRIRLESAEERPELREGFRHPDLIAWVRQARPRLLAAGLTILGGYAAAGRPDQRLKAWGSFAGWSDLVRGAVVWAGMADPGETRVTISDSDPTAEALGALLVTWQQADPHRRGLTAGEFIKIVQDSQPREWTDMARAALDVLLDRVEARMLGNRLRSYRRRIVGGLFFDRAGERQNAIRWAAYPAEAFGRRLEKTHETHETHAPASPFEPSVAEPYESGESRESSPAADDDVGTAGRHTADFSSYEFTGPYGERF